MQRAGFIPPPHWTETAGQLKQTGNVTLNAEGIGAADLQHLLAYLLAQRAKE